MSIECFTLCDIMSRLPSPHLKPLAPKLLRLWNPANVNLSASLADNDSEAQINCSYGHTRQLQALMMLSQTTSTMISAFLAIKMWRLL